MISSHRLFRQITKRWTEEQKVLFVQVMWPRFFFFFMGCGKNQNNENKSTEWFPLSSKYLVRRTSGSLTPYTVAYRSNTDLNGLNSGYFWVVEGLNGQAKRMSPTTHLSAPVAFLESVNIVSHIITIRKCFKLNFWPSV